MLVLGLMRVQNGGAELRSNLDSIAELCDELYAIDDRSVDHTPDILGEHPLVTNVVRARKSLPATPWLIGEDVSLELLYRMADFCQPDWVIALDHDQTVRNPDQVRRLLDDSDTQVAGIEGTVVSRWSDPLYPDMVPIMGKGRSRRCLVWRYAPGLRPGSKKNHNGYSPVNLEGEVRFEASLVVDHSGWETLGGRIDRAKRYLELDPDSKWNQGVPYDRGLLFGYALNEVGDLVAEYRRRYAAAGNFSDTGYGHAPGDRSGRRGDKTITPGLTETIESAPG